MAEQDEQKGSGGGGDEDKYPIGFRFKPKDVELIEYYLLPRLQGRPSVPNDAIIEANVYECHPDTLINEKYRSRGEGEWFFLSPRARMYQNGVRPSRKTEDSRGRWKASTATKLVAKERVGESKTKFCKTVLNYFVGSPKNERRTKWLMRELTIPEYEIKLDKTGPNNTLDEYVICKIYVSPVHKGNDDEASTSSACEEAQQSQGTAESKLSERQAGKRPVEKQTQRRGAPRKQARQQKLTIGSAPPFGAGNASGTAGYYGAPGQPTGYNGQVPMQRPAGILNGQTPVQRPPGTYNGQALEQFPPNSAATNPNSFGRTTMTMRPPNLAGQAIRPPCFPGDPMRQKPATGYRPRVFLNSCYDQNYGAVQPPGNASYGMQQQRATAFAPPPQQQPYFNGTANHDVRATIPRCPPYNYHPYQYSPMTPAVVGDHGGATSPAAPVSGAADQASGTGDCNINAEHHFVELAAINTFLAGARPQTAPAAAPRVESAAPIRAAELKAEMEETSFLQKQDTA